MDLECPRPEDLAEIMTLPADDPRRCHLDECPRCRNLARRYRDFLAPTPLPPEADAEAAGRMLRQRLTTALPELAPALETAGRPEAAPAACPRRSRAWRPLLAAAAVIVCCVGLLSIRNELTRPHADQTLERGILRGDQPGPVVLDVRRAEDGLELVWKMPADVDACEAVLFDAKLLELVRLDAGTTGRCLVPQVPDGTAYVQVEFLEGGDVVSSTRPVPLPADH